MLREKGLLCLSDNNRSPTVPHPAHELAVKGDDCPSWRVSLVVKFNIWLNETRRVPIILKMLISIRDS